MTTNHETPSLLAASGVCLIDQQGRIVAADQAANKWLASIGLENAKPIGLIDDLLPAGECAEGLRQIFEGEATCAFDALLQMDRRGADRVHVELRRLEGASGPLALAMFHRDGARSAPLRDALTGLPDRRAIAEWVASHQRDVSGSPPPFALLFLDLDDFKLVNDQHGHAAGDRVLEQLAARWIRLVRDGDLVARYGGDEFVLLLKNVATAADAEPIMRRLAAATLEPIELGELQFHVAATIGVMIAAGRVTSLEELIAAADRDMYARKRSEPK